MSTRSAIIEAAVRVVAREGYHGLSFAKVVEEAGLSSTRLISYHFGTRDALLTEAFGHVLERAAAFMSPRIAEQSAIRDKVRVYITSNLGFLAADPTCARAAVELAANLDPAPSYGGLELLVAGFEAGQASGELRSFDPRAAAVALRGAIDASVLAVVSGGADPERAGAELAELIDRGIRA